jgi:hypothetical protein
MRVLQMGMCVRRSKPRYLRPRGSFSPCHKRKRSGAEQSEERIRRG